jgi:hypothetical protein
MKFSSGVAHMFGDYVVQTDHMARNKVKTADAPDGVLEAAQHALIYSLCYLPVTRSPKALAVIGSTHYVIDRYRLAKKVVWARNQLAPSESRYPYAEAGPFGQRMGQFDGEVVAMSPDWLSGWLLFLCDNAMHLAINEWAISKWEKS